MRDKLKLKVSKDELTIEEGENTLLGKAIAGCQGTVRLNTGRVHREIHKVKNKEGKVLKDDKHPENIGRVEKKK